MYSILSKPTRVPLTVASLFDPKYVLVLAIPWCFEKTKCLGPYDTCMFGELDPLDHFWGPFSQRALR